MQVQSIFYLRKKHIKNFVDWAQNPFIHLAVLVCWQPGFWQLQVENKFCERVDAPVRLVQVGDGAGGKDIFA